MSERAESTDTGRVVTGIDLEGVDLGGRGRVRPELEDVMSGQTEGAEGTIDGVPFTYEQAKIVAAREAEAWERGRADERHYAAVLRDYHHWSNISAGPPTDPPNPYRAAVAPSRVPSEES